MRPMSTAKILAGDIGGTKTLLGLFESVAFRPHPIVVAEYVTIQYPDLQSMISEFAMHERVRGVAVDTACFGVAGPVLADTAELTNVPFRIDAAEIRRRFDIPRVTLLNDLQAMASAVPTLRPSELHQLQAGTALRDGNIGLIAAGTGLGEALLHNVNGHFIPSPSEAGHADWAPRNDREIELLRDLMTRFGRAEVEHVVSGRGLVNIHRITHDGPCSEVHDESAPDAPAQISKAGLEGRCRGCVEALGLFVDAYGAEAGNVALRGVCTGGVFIGGGIAPKIMPALTDGRFMRAFRNKAPLEEMLAHTPVHIILNDES